MLWILNNKNYWVPNGPQLAQLVLSSSSFSYLFSTLFLLPLGTRTDQVGDLREPGPAGPNILYIYIYSYNIFHLCNGPFQNLRYSFSLISLTNLTKLATIQPKKLTKILQPMFEQHISQNSITTLKSKKTRL